MSQYDVITYGVYILDLDDWRQVSEHWLLPQAIERACESHEILGAQIRVRSSQGIVLLEIPQAAPSGPHREQRPRARQFSPLHADGIRSKGASLELRPIQYQH